MSFLAALISKVSGVTILRWATSPYPASRPWDRSCAITAHPLPRISRELFTQHTLVAQGGFHRFDYNSLRLTTEGKPSGCRDLMREEISSDTRLSLVANLHVKLGRTT